MGTSHPGLTLKNRRILIVASNRSMVRNLTDILQPRGYLVTDVNSGDAAMTCFASFKPDLVLLEVELPGAQVFKICRHFSDRHTRDGATVIFIAAKSEPAEVVEGLAAGGVDYLSRPFREQEVLARIRVHLLNRLRLAQLDKEDQAKNRLLSTAAHDLRNPLVSIRALANLMRAGTVGSITPEQRDLLDTVFDASQSMLDLVNELLDISVLEAGELKISRHPTSLANLIEACVRMNNAIAAEKGSSIRVRPGPLPPELDLDGPKVRQVLNNLLGNAIKFSPPGSVTSIELETTPHHCAIAIVDQGPGIPEEEKNRLFKDFSRTSVQPTGGESTTGLGLSICRAIMHAHAGTIGVQNRPGGGAEFRITFPLHP